MNAGSRADSTLVSIEDVEDFVVGTDLLSGGGGAPTEALTHLIATYSADHRIAWSPVHELADDALVVSTFYVGATDPASWVNRSGNEHSHGLTHIHPRPLETATSRLEQMLGRACDAIIPIEIGASNTAAALDAGIRLGRRVLDGDWAGRAIPSLDCILPAAQGLVDAPLVLADYYGDIVEVPQSANVGRLESICKQVALAALGRIGAAGLVMTGEQVKAIAVRGTLTASLRAGRLLRLLRESGLDVPAELARRIPGARLLFTGTLTETQRLTDPRYMSGTHHLKGSEQWAGHALRIRFCNENHVAWLDDEVLLTSPDVIQVIDRHSGEPLGNTYLDRGHEIAVLGLPCDPAWMEPAATALLSPARWDVDANITLLPRDLSKHEPVGAAT